MKIPNARNVIEKAKQKFAPEGRRHWKDLPTVSKQEMLRGVAVDEYELAKERGYGPDNDKESPEGNPKITTG